jgi:hypothetical protein
LVEISVDAEKGKALSVFGQYGSADDIGEQFAFTCHEGPAGRAHAEDGSPIAALAGRNAPSSALRNLTTSISLSIGGVRETLENLGSER